VLTSSDGVHGGDGLLAGISGLAGAAAIAVVLTGLQRDGAVGVQEIKRRGGRVLVQDPATARGAGMPSAAIASGCVDFVLPLDRIGPALVALVMAPGGAAFFAVPTSPWARLPA
jgi:two-component system chemotaxis response regulator CheB